jgi:uncharacterized protein YndB with AHSA1/START domain
VTRTLPFTIDEVWHALTERESINAWFCETDFVAEVGRSFTFRDRPRLGWSGVMQGEVLTVEAPTRLAYTFRSDFLKQTTVEFKLEGKGEHTQVTIEHSGFSGFTEVIVGRFLKGGWADMFGRRMPELLRRQRSAA